VLDRDAPRHARPRRRPVDLALGEDADVADRPTEIARGAVEDRAIEEAERQRPAQSVEVALRVHALLGDRRAGYRIETVDHHAQRLARGMCVDRPDRAPALRRPPRDRALRHSRS